MAQTSTATVRPIRSRSQRENTARVKSLVHAMPNGVVLLDARGYIREVNDEAIRLLGEPLEGTLWRKVIARAFRPQHDDGHEVSLQSGRRVRLDISSLSPEPGQLIVLTDLSETRALQARVSHLQRLTAMGRMVASLAHQIRTPLSAALLYAENLSRDGLEPAQQHKFVHKLKDRLKDLEQQVNDMLLYAKSGEQQPVQPIGMTELVSKLEAQVAATMEQQEVEFTVAVQCPQAHIMGNLNSLLGALQNIVINAAQASSEKSTVELNIDQHDEHVVLKVKDHGRGINAEDLPQIFTPFFTRKTHGTGLGLAVVKTVVNAHQGEIQVHSEVGKGSVFEITLPVAAGSMSQKEVSYGA